MPPRPHHAELNLPIAMAVKPAEEAITVAEPSPEDSSNLKEQQLKAPRISTAAKPRDARVVAAGLKVQEYRSQQLTRTTVIPAALRAYYIWHDNSDLVPEAIAGLLRDPPLQTHTVVFYILDAVAVAKLPYSKDRLKAEVVSCLTSSRFAGGKYKAVISDCHSP